MSTEEIIENIDTGLKIHNPSSEDKIVEKEPQLSLEIKDEDEDILDKSIQSGKPKKERTEKQKLAFEKARKTRAENVKKRAEEKKKNSKPVGRPKKQKQEINPLPKVKDIINQELEKEYTEENNNIVSESESDPEPEIIYKKKPKQKKKKVVKKKKKPKKKVVYISDDSSSSESESESDDEILVKQITKKKNKKVYYQDEPEYQEISYNNYKPPSITDFYKVM